MPLQNLEKIGFVSKAKGLKGALKISFEAFFYDYLEHPDSPVPTHFFLPFNNAFIPYFIEHLAADAHIPTVKFEEVDTRTQAEKLSHKAVFFDKELLEKYQIDTSDEEYWDYLIGYTLVNSNNELVVGKVVSIVYLPAHELLQTYQDGREILVPLNEALITNINEAEQRIHLDIPDGLLEVFLDTE